MKCPRCHTDLTDDARFCGVCGSALPAPQDVNATQTMPTSVVPGDNEATLMAASWPGSQPSSPQSPMNAAPLARRAPVSPQPEPAGASWPQQPAQAGWSSPTQPPVAYPPGMALGTMNSASAVAYPVKHKRGGRALRRFLLVLVLLVAVLAGAWFFGVRPYVHNLVQTQLTQALDGAESEMVLFQTALPPGGQIVHVDEGSMNNYLSGRDVSPLQNLHVTILPDGLHLDFSAYGFTNSIIVTPIAVGGGLQVTNVQVQGVLGLVMSSDELTTTLNTNFQSFSHQLTRTIQAITLHEHEMDVQFH